jgi:hypothetical protein
LTEWNTAFATAASDSVRTMLFYELEHAIDAESLEITTPAEAAQVARILSDLLAPGRPPVLRWVAAERLVTHPHPAAADALYGLAREHDGLGPDVALQALVSLRDPRSFSILREQLHRYSEATPHTYFLRLLVELGEPRALPLLEKHLADRHLESAFAKAIRRNPRVPARPKAKADSLGAEMAVTERNETRRAIRDLKALIEDGIYSPFALSDDALAGLRRNGFFILPNDPLDRFHHTNEMYELYTPEYPFVTTDIVFHTFMILARAALDEVEALVLQPRIGQWSKELTSRAIQQSRSRLPRAMVPLAWRNADFFAVPAVLLGSARLDTLSLPAGQTALVQQEIELILRAETVTVSPILGITEDYTQYKPRGRFSTRPEMAGYFQAMVWYGRAIFRVESEEDTRRVLLLLDILQQHPSLRAEWLRIDSVLGCLFGPRDDLAFPDYEEAARSISPPLPTPAKRSWLDEAGQLSLLPALRDELERKPPPRINTRHLDEPAGSTWKRRATGMRVFGQRFTRPARLFQEDLDRGVWPVTSLRIAADLLGSREAAAVLDGQAGAPPGSASSSRSELSVPSALPDPYGDLTEGTLYCATALFHPEPSAPPFMHRPAWGFKSINTALGAWAEVRHATALYDKDANQYKGCSTETDRFHGYVEPAPVFFQRLDSLVQRFTGELDQSGFFEEVDSLRERLTTQKNAIEAEDSDWRLRGPTVTWDPAKGLEVSALSENRSRRRKSQLEAQLELPDRARFARLSGVIRRCEAIARQELRGEGQSMADGVFLKSFGERLRHLSFNVSSSEHARRSMALITDPATEFQSGECLEVAVGNPDTIYVAVPDDGRTFVCRGAVYTFYEFTSPIRDRLDDTEWQAILSGPPEKRPVPWILTRPEVRGQNDR